MNDIAAQDNIGDTDPSSSGARREPEWVRRVTSVAKKLEVLSTISGYVASAFLILVILLTLLDIFGRNVFRISLIRGSTELSSWAMAAISWLALSYAMKTDGHIQVRILVDRLPAKVRRVLAVILALMGVALLAFIVRSMWGRLIFTLQKGVTGVEVKVSVAIIYSVVFVGAVLLLLEVLIKLWYSLVPFFGGKVDAGVFGSELEDLKHELREEDQAVLADMETDNHE